MSYYNEHAKEATAKRIDYDLSAAINYGLYDNNDGFRLEDVSYVLASVLGENDGPDYWWLIAMEDHTYAVVNGSCDYTGWDCQSSSTASIYPTLLEALKNIPESDDYNHRAIKPSIIAQLNGQLAFGEVKA